jgi:cyanate permease
MVVAFSEQSVFLISTGAAIFGIGFGAAFPAYGTSARANFPARQFGFWLATMWCLSFICAGFGSWAGGLFRDALGNYKTGFAFASGLILAGSLVAQPLLYATRKQQFKG